MHHHLFPLELIHEPKYYVESSAAAEQQGLVSLWCRSLERCFNTHIQVFASLPSEASIARLKMQAFIKEVPFTSIFLQNSKTRSDMLGTSGPMAWQDL